MGFCHSQPFKKQTKKRYRVCFMDFYLISFYIVKTKKDIHSFFLLASFEREGEKSLRDAVVTGGGFVVSEEM